MWYLIRQLHFERNRSLWLTEKRTGITKEGSHQSERDHKRYKNKYQRQTFDVIFANRNDLTNRAILAAAFVISFRGNNHKWESHNKENDHRKQKRDDTVSFYDNRSFNLNLRIARKLLYH